jgi:hypothetical protein
MQSSHKVNDQDFSGDIQAKKEWHKPEIVELQDKNTILGADVSGGSDLHSNDS